MKKNFHLIILLGILFVGFLFEVNHSINKNTAMGQLRLSDEQIVQTKRVLNGTNFAGNITIYKNGQKVWEDTTANKPNSAYLINSVQKVFTAGLIMKAVDNKQLTLDTKVSQFYPNVPNADNITILNLLEMTSGLSAKGPMGNAPYNNDEDNAQKAIQDTNFDGSKFNQWNYQDVDYVLLSHILEKATGQSYEALFDNTYVFPLKLKHTDFMWADVQKAAEINLVNTNQVNMNEIHGLLGAGSVAMSNDDLYKASKSVLDGRLLSKQDRDTIYAPGNNQPHYRGGFYNKGDHYESNGSGYGYYNFVRISKDGKNAVIMQLTNSSNFKDISNKVTQIYQNVCK